MRWQSWRYHTPAVSCSEWWFMLSILTIGVVMLLNIVLNAWEQQRLSHLCRIQGVS